MTVDSSAEKLASVTGTPPDDELRYRPPVSRTMGSKVWHYVCYQPFNRLTLLQKILLSNLIIILGGAIIGSWLTAQLAEAGKFNLVTFSIITAIGVLFSGAVSFAILKAAFRPFDELQRVLSKIHTGNPRARAALNQITNPDVRQFTGALNQMLTRLEENARIIQEDQRQLQQMTARVINAQENERKRIARELHDEASQSLTAMIMGLEAASRQAPSSDTVLQLQLEGLKELAAATLEEIRKLALDLRPTMLDDLGLIPAVRWLSRSTAQRAGLEMQLELEDFEEDERLAPEIETCLFRITQESLTNIVRHAEASCVLIQLNRVLSKKNGQPMVRLALEDNGKGFDRGEARHKAYEDGHLGLFDIEERATLLGGKVEFSPVLPGMTRPGTRLTVLLPLTACLSGVGNKSK